MHAYPSTSRTARLRTLVTTALPATVARAASRPDGQGRAKKIHALKPALAETVIAPRSTANLGEEGAVPGRAPSTSAASDQRGARAPSAGGATSTLIGAIPQISRA